jgi:phospholipid/cholesterol/gamma-HCH transport system permease protein
MDGTQPPLHAAPGPWLPAPVRWLAGWWRLLDFGSQMLVLALSPSSYRRSQRQVMYRQLHAATAPLLSAFALVAAVVSLVIIRIVVATAASYGLSRYALDVLVRTLVLELLPLLVALFVALRYTMPGAEVVATLRAEGKLKALWRAGGDPARDELLPRVVAGVFAVALLAALGCLMALLLTYLTVYGFTTWGFDAYTRTVGQVFNPAVTLIFAFKALFFSLTVAIVPIAPDQLHPGDSARRRRDNIGLLGRVFALILLGEVFSLIGNYY